jgi:short-subunit dehydrogenase
MKLKQITDNEFQHFTCGKTEDSTISSPKKVVLITGASTGLGLALALELMKEPTYHLILTARRSSLDRFSTVGIFENSRVSLRSLDVTKAFERKKLLREIELDFGGVDILINNAGVAMKSVAEHATEEDRVRQMQVNYIGPMRLIALVLPGMRRKQAGRIINISSASGIVGMPTMACYSASKFALDGATECLWYEVRPWNIFVTLVIPGFIASDSYKKTRNTHLSEIAMIDSNNSYHLLYAQMLRLVSRMMNLSPFTPQRIAKKIRKILAQNKPNLRVPVTPDAFIFWILKRFMPQALYQEFIFRVLGGKTIWGLQRKRPRSNIRTTTPALSFEIRKGSPPTIRTHSESKIA